MMIGWVKNTQIRKKTAEELEKWFSNGAYEYCVTYTHKRYPISTSYANDSEWYCKDMAGSKARRLLSEYKNAVKHGANPTDEFLKAEAFDGLENAPV